MALNKNTDPLIHADDIGVTYTKSVSQAHKKEQGQFFTPIKIAALMANLPKIRKQNSFKVLDPGCGTGILSIALIRRITEEVKGVEEIYLCCYETDQALVPYTKQSIKVLENWLKNKKIKLKFNLVQKDFVLDNERFFSEGVAGDYDFVISNPPYFKLSRDDKRALIAKRVVSGQPNIYSVFMALSSAMLNEKGQLIFITPRSYTSGNYFKAFREYLLDEVKLDKVHLFVSRKDTFNRDSVLQETVIISASKIKKPQRDYTVEIGTSFGLRDIDTPTCKQYHITQLVDFSSNEKILHFPTNDNEEAIIYLFKSWKGSLAEYGIKVSTGPVVAFRSWDYIKDQYQNGKVFLAPLFWLHNVEKMRLTWPVPKPQKGQYILISDASRSLLIPNKDYILLRRFSTKDDKSRLIAAPYFKAFQKAEYIGVENKVNYIYRPGGELETTEVVGLCAVLNSELFDTYFGIFNGNVNVSATELREMAFPPLESIKRIGKRVLDSNDYSMENVNQIVSEAFELSEILS
ncbi:MAG TPA: N-6 DNA methylase [Bacteroidia bacterium]|nr:Eco57I restriction-modification methylase domain-containing protein [Bacteroidia bacterium]HSH65399.1 N-6 DNA methylase [Bacteroidia bacterium]